MSSRVMEILCNRIMALWLAVLFMALGIASCGRNSASQPWHLMNINGDMPALQFTLTSDDDKTVTQKNYLGKIVLLYFGYSHCTDVCPTTLADIGSEIRKLGPSGNQIQVLFVSVDPARDTPAVLKKYVNAFGPWFVGLTGNQQQLLAITKRYRVAYRLGKPDAHGNYTVYHSSAVFIFDRQGKARLLTTLSDKPTAVVADLKRLIAE